MNVMNGARLEDVCVILPAAGEGTRMNIGERKQFIDVGGKPVISYTIDNFESLDWVKVIVVVVSGGWRLLVEGMVGRFGWKKVRVVEGGSSRHRSIYHALRVLPEVVEGEPGMVVVHDAVRPIINHPDLRAVVMTAGMCGASGLVRRVTSTILKVEGGVMLGALERGNMWESHTPQAFDYNLLRQAYEGCSDEDLDNGTECLDLVFKHSSHFSRSSSSPTPSSTSTSSSSPNIRLIEATSLFNKITYQEDLKAFEVFLKEQVS